MKNPFGCFFLVICSFAAAGVAFGESVYTDVGGVEYISVEYLESSGGQ